MDTRTRSWSAAVLRILVLLTVLGWLAVRPADGRQARPSAAVARLADALAGAPDDRARSAILEHDPELVTADLAAELSSRSGKARVEGRWVEAKRCADAGMVVALRLAQPKLLARCYQDLANIERDQGRDRSAAGLYLRAEAEAARAGDAIGQARAWQGRALVARRARDYAAALALARKAEAAFRHTGSPMEIAVVTLNIGTIEDDMDDRERALASYTRALAMFTKLKDDLGMAMALANSAIIHHYRGDYRRAVDYGSRALTLYDRIRAAPMAVKVLNNLGTVYDDMGDYAQAESHYARSLEIKRELGDRAGAAQTLNNLGVLYSEQSNYEKARAVLQQSLSIREAIGDEAGVAESLLNLAVAERTLGPGRAVATARRATDLARRTGSTTRVVAALLAESECRLDADQAVDARRLLHEALKLLGPDAGPDRVAACAAGIGATWRRQGRLREAAAAYRRAIDATESVRASLPEGARERRQYYRGRLTAYHGLVETLAGLGRTSEALAVAETCKSRALLDALVGGVDRIVTGLSAAERARERMLTRKVADADTRRAEAQQSGAERGRVASLTSQLRRARLAYEAQQSALYAAHPRLRAARGQVKPVSMRDLRGLLPDAGSALLEYVVSPKRTLLFVATLGPDRRVRLRRHTIAADADQLVRAVSAFRKVVSDPDYPFADRARALHRLLLGPAHAQLRGASRWIVAPDGPLWDLPFHCLQGADGRFVAQDVAVSYAPSLTVLRELRARRTARTRKRPATLLAMGNPLPTEPANGAIALRTPGDGAAMIPESEAEVRAIARLYGAGRSRVCTQAAATESTFRSAAARYGVVHFATHGVLDDSSAMYSSVLLAPGPSRRDDGRLEAWELMNADLSADLLVLSACETARGDTNAGEGMVGMAWAALVAGCRAVVASQWRVRSDATTQLMVDFHRSWLASSSGQRRTSEALRRASLAMMRRPGRSHPFYWGGFVVVGDGG